MTTHKIPSSGTLAPTPMPTVRPLSYSSQSSQPRRVILSTVTTTTWDPLPIDHPFTPLRFQISDPCEVFSNPTKRDSYLEALYDFGLSKLREQNGDEEDERSVGEKRADGAEHESRRCCGGIASGEVPKEIGGTEIMREAQAKSGQEVRKDHGFMAGYDVGYGAGLKAGMKVTRRPGDLKRGAEERGLLRKQRARLGWSRKGLLGGEQERIEGMGGDGMGVRVGCVDAACMRRMDRQHAANDKQRLELALMVTKRKEERMEAEMRKAGRKSVLEKSQLEPSQLFARHKRSGSDEKGSFKKRTSASSLTLVGTRETVVTEKGVLDGQASQLENECLWARVKRKLRSVRCLNRFEKERGTEAEGNGSLCGSDLGTREAWWSCR